MGIENLEDYWLEMTDEEIEDLPRKLCNGDPIDDDERVFLARLVLAHGQKKVSPREVSRIKSKALAISTYALILRNENRSPGELPRKWLMKEILAAAAKTSGLSERRVFKILEEHRPLYEEMRKEYAEYVKKTPPSPSGNHESI